MKDFSLKFVSIFIILMFCLAPLSAADLNAEDNNNKYNKKNIDDINIDDGNVNVDDVNITEDDSESKNESVVDDSSSERTSDADGQNTNDDIDSSLNVNKTSESSNDTDEENLSLNVSEKYDPDLRIKINDIVLGQKPVVEITADSNLNGPVRVKVNGSKYTYTLYHVNVVNGYGNVTIDEDLLIGTYTATVTYIGDDVFKESESSTTFTVSPEKVDPKLGIKVNDIVQGQRAVAEITANSNFNGPVCIKVNGSKYTYKPVVVNGSKQYTLSDDLKPGTYTATASYEGDDVFNHSESSTTFTVYAADPELNIKVNDIVQGQRAVAEITANSNYNGPVCIKVNGSKYTYKTVVLIGSKQYTLSDDLKPGTYTATASYEGDDVFKPSESSTTFTVSPEKVDPKLGIKVKDIYCGQRAVAEVTANSSLNGPALVKVNGSESSYRVDIVNGSGNVTIDEDLLPGNYTATVSYAGDAVFKESESPTTFTVVKADPKLRINVRSTSNGQRVVADVHANSTINGYVTVKLNPSGITYRVPLVSGYGNVTIDEDLSPGNYTATVSYAGDAVFKPSENSETFIVDYGDVDPKLRINVSDILVGQKAVAKVTANSTLNGSVTVKLSSSVSSYRVNMVNGSGNVTIDEDLLPGNYTATVSYAGDAVFKFSESSTNFTVSNGDVDPKLRINVRDIVPGQRAVAEVTANSTLNGSVTVKLSSSVSSYRVNMVNGSGNVTIDEDLLPGNYTATVSYAGDAVFKESESSTTFTVVKVDPKLGIKVRDVIQGQNPVAELTANSTLNDKVCIKVKGSGCIHYAYIVNGSINYTLDLMDDLKPGIYTATVTYDGDAMFKESESSTTFTVYAADPKLSIKVKDIYCGQRAVAEIAANSTLNGRVIVKLNQSSTTYGVNVVNGYGNFTIDEDLLPGNYTATVSYGGDDVFIKSESSTSFTVHSGDVDPDLRIKVTDSLFYGHMAVEIAANSSLNGQALVKVNGSESSYRADIVNGSGNVTIDEDLLPGNYTVTVSYVGNGVFKPSESSASFTLDYGDVDPDLRIKVRDMVCGYKAVAEVTANSTLNGQVLVKLDSSDNSYRVNVVNGSGNVTLDEELLPGNYRIRVSYAGDAVFKESESFASFTVSKADPKLNIKVRDIVQGQTPVAELTANSAFNDKVRIKVIGSSYIYYSDIVNGSKNYTLDLIEDLKPGNYTVTVTYDGSAVFKESESSTTFNVYNRNVRSDLSIKVSDIKCGQRAVAELTANSTLNGSVTVKLNSSDTTYHVPIVNGYGKFIIAEKLLPANYTITASYAGDDVFNESENSTTFTVYPGDIDPDLSIKVSDVSDGQREVADVHANSTLNGQAIVKLNSSDNIYRANIVNGSGNVTIDEDLLPGNYTVTVSYAGDAVFKDSECSSTFHVFSEEVDPDLRIKVSDMVYGHKAVAEVTANSTLNGRVTVKLNSSDTTYRVNVVNGSGNVTLDEELLPGNYRIRVSYAGDAVFKESESFASFTVSKADPKLNIKVRDIVQGQNPVAELTANSSFNGNVNIRLNGSNHIHYTDIVNGSKNYTLDLIEDLKPGTYTATVTYYGDDIFEESESSTTFTVYQENVDPDLRIKVSDIDCGQMAVAEVTANSSLNGPATVKINSSDNIYRVNIVNGSGNVTIDEDLLPGSYAVTVAYAGDELFKESKSSTTFTVYPEMVDSDLRIKSDGTSNGSEVAEVSANDTLNGFANAKLNSSDIKKFQKALKKISFISPIKVKI